ncbi:hypothetical protein TIFTF001_022241, partial [Ficus carica]
CLAGEKKCAPVEEEISVKEGNFSEINEDENNE